MAWEASYKGKGEGVVGPEDGVGVAGEEVEEAAGGPALEVGGGRGHDGGLEVFVVCVIVGVVVGEDLVGHLEYAVGLVGRSVVSGS